MRQFFRSLTIKNKLFSTFAIAFIIIITIIGAAIYVNNVNEMKKQTQAMSTVLSTQFSRTLDLYFKDIERLSLGVFTDPFIQETLIGYGEQNSYDDIAIKNNMYSRLFSQLYPNSEIEGITIYTTTGTVFDYEKNGDMEVRYESLKKDWMGDLDELSKSSFLLIPTREEFLLNGKKENVVSLVRHIYEIPQREKIGSVKIDINIAAFEEMLEVENVEHLEEHLRILVTSETGAVIYDDENKLIGEEKIELELPRAEERNMLWKDQYSLYASDHSDFTDWDTIILIDDAFIINERKQMLLFIGISGLIVIVIIAIISYFLAHSITKPLMVMMKKMKRVEKGDLANRMKLTGNTDVDVVTRVYNRMLDSINKLIKEVYESSITEKNAKISALQSQINPHFLYNTLNVMKSISRVRGVEEVAEISESLADLFKYSMKDLDKQVLLSEELQHIENYMRIQQYRFMDRIKLKEEIAAHIDTALIPKLLIQPLVENAVNHGLGKKKKDGLVTVCIFKEEENLIIEVQDNGEGMTEDELDKVRESINNKSIDPVQEGIGLNNIAQRIRLMHGYPYGLEAKSEKNKGTVMRLTLPYQTANTLPKEA